MRLSALGTPFASISAMEHQLRLKNLIRKYDQSGPRYTSYPPAPVFSPGYGPVEYREDLLTIKEHGENRDLSLYFHIPFCDTLCYFCGCTTIITNSRPGISKYLDYLKREITQVSSLLNRERRVVQMHWGGGTPTILSPSEITDLGQFITKQFRLADGAEVSVEIDPRELTIEHMKALRGVGFNRISLGVQDFNERVQKAVNRIQSESLTRQVIDWSRQLGFGSLNLDLIYGLPLQTLESFNETLDKIIDISPERIAVYNFAYVPWMKKHHRVIHPEDLPQSETKIAILGSTVEKLTGSGYVYVGMDHFAKPTDELVHARNAGTLRRNFQGYSTNAGSDLHGFGMSSISHFGSVYAQNAKTLPEYYAAIDAGRLPTILGYRMTHDDEIRKDVIMRLMCDLTLDLEALGERYGIDTVEYFADSLAKLGPIIEDGLITKSGSRLTVEPLGRFFLRNIAMCFDAHLAKRAGQERPLFSRTV